MPDNPRPEDIFAILIEKQLARAMTEAITTLIASVKAQKDEINTILDLYDAEIGSFLLGMNFGGIMEISPSSELTMSIFTDDDPDNPIQRIIRQIREEWERDG